MKIEKNPDLAGRDNFYENVSYYLDILSMIPKVFILSFHIRLIYGK